MIFSKTDLPGGIRILTERMPEIRSVALGFWIGVGSRDEAPDLQGSAHFLEHLLFKGSAAKNAADIAEAFDAVGGEANAFSAKEYTCLHGRVLDADLGMATDLCSEMLWLPALRPDEVESERKVIFEEISMHEDTPDDLVHDLFAEDVFGNHALGRSVLGTNETVGQISVESLRAFHQTHYRGRNVVVAAAGSVDHDELVDRIAQLFPRDDGTLPPPEQSAPLPARRMRAIHRSTEQVHLVVGGPGYSRQHPDRWAWGVLDTLLGGGMSSRLFQEIREKRGLAYSVYSYRNLFRETGLYGIYAGATPANAVDVLQLILEEMDRMAEEGITEEELERGKGHMRGSMVLSLEDPSSRMSRLGKSELVQGEILSIDELVARINAVTLEDVARVAADLLGPEARVLSVIGPAAEEDFVPWFGNAEPATAASGGQLKPDRRP